jgi:hypothetical protein
MDPSAAWIICHSFSNLCYILIYIISLILYMDLHSKVLSHRYKHSL